MAKSKPSAKIYIISGIVALIGSVIFCSFLTILFLNIFTTPPPSEPEKSEPPIILPSPTLNVPSSITLELLQQGTIIYSVKDLGNYVISIAIEDTSIATLSGTTITPIKVGTTKIIYTINTSPKIIKETTLNIIDCTKEVAFYITTENQSAPDVYYTNTYYILEIRHNLLPAENPTINIGNLSEFSLIKTENNSYFFKFKIKNAGDFSFNYIGKYVSLNKTYPAVNFPIEFNVTFTNGFNDNKLTLYLYDTNFTTDAQNDNIFNTTNFEIVPSTNTIDNILLNANSYDKSIIQIFENTITALAEGETTIEFYSSISGIVKTYNVKIIKVTLSKIMINGEVKQLNATENIELAHSETYCLNYNKFPVYCIGTLTLNYNPAELNYENGAFSIIAGVTNSQITITYLNEVVYTINISAKLEVLHNVTIFQTSSSATLENNILSATFAENFYITLNIKALNANTNQLLPNQTFSLNAISNNSVCICTDERISNGNLTLQIIGTGTCTLTIADLYYNVNIALTINIS